MTRVGVSFVTDYGQARRRIRVHIPISEGLPRDLSGGKRYSHCTQKGMDTHPQEVSFLDQGPVLKRDSNPPPCM